jgi:hypothetical protein
MVKVEVPVLIWVIAAERGKLRAASIEKRNMTNAITFTYVSTAKHFLKSLTDVFISDIFSMIA